MSGRSVFLTILFLGKPPSDMLSRLSVHYFDVLLKSVEEEEWPKKHFHDQTFMTSILKE